LSDSLRPISRPRLYEQLMERLLDHIREQGLVVGDRLPGERELAERLQVSRNSLKQAMVALEVQGIVETRHGGGTYFRGGNRAPEKVSTLLDRQRRLPEILEAREAIEVKLAELAALRRTPANLDEMKRALHRMTRLIDEGESSNDADREFHSQIVLAGGNAILASFYQQIGPEISEARLESLRQPGRPARSLAQHWRILEAIEAGEPKRAAAAMRRHIATVGTVRLLTWQPKDTDEET
jgi:GntR family transcriptional regulator, transcriptional repressor for pyruvate dehydrogenase complex